MRNFLVGAKNTWRISREGLATVPSLWVAVSLYAVLNAFTGALAAVILPRAIAEPAMAHGILVALDEIRIIFFPSLLVALIFLTYAIYLLGGTISSMSLVVSGEAISFRTFLKQANHCFLGMVKWTVGSIFLMVLPGSLLILVTVIVWSVTRKILFMQIVSVLIFLFVVLPPGLFLLYSPIIAVKQRTKFWDSFRQSRRFLCRHFWESMWFLVWTVLIGSIVCLLWIIPVVVMDRISQYFGIEPYSWSFFTVFSFGVILWIPAAVIAVYFPIVLYRFYYHYGKI